MLLILAKKKTGRLQYTAHLLLEDLLGIPFQITHSESEFLSWQGPRISYGLPLENEIYLASNGLLFESGISVKNINCFEYEGVTAIFPVHESSSILPFDIFSASFYLVSRYEEYLPHIMDEHGRFLANGSDAFKHGFLRKPVVNIWAIMLGKLLKSYFPSLQIKQQKYQFIPTIDIDAAYAYKNKGITRTLGGLFNSFRRKDYQEMKERIKVILNQQQDPFDTFRYLFELQEKNKLRMLYFILMADYGPRDKNLPVNNRKFLRLLKLISDYAEVGIHPSYASATNPELTGIELNRLSKVLHREIQMSRQHFLRLKFPVTYRNLLNLDITDDYTMGYAEQPGFRASICTPFFFYDLDLDVETHLRIHPFTVMDGTLQEYLRLSPEQAIDVLTSLINEIKNVNGVFIPLWHNQTLNDQKEWKGWLKVFEKMVQLAKA
jgi:hypothetical protein